MDWFAARGLSLADAAEFVRLGGDQGAESSADRRRRLDRERKRLRKSAEISAESAESEADTIPQIPQNSAGNSAEIPQPHVRVLDKPLTKVLTGSVVVDDEARAGAPNDWPADKLAQRLAAAIESPFIDPNKSPGMITSGRVLASWRAAGASWEHDVIPIVAALAAKNRKPINSWSYFEAAVLQSAADSRRALTLPEASPQQAHERNHQPPNNRAAGRGVWSEIIAEHDGAPARDLARA
jgi:hypothetical protein